MLYKMAMIIGASLERVLELPFLGVLEEEYPAATYEEIKAMRVSNWDVFKAACDLRKTVRGRVFLPPSVVEMYKPGDEFIALTGNDGLTISGVSEDLTEIVVYPFAPRNLATDFVFTPQQGTRLSLSSTTYKQEAQRKYESYQCVLRKDSNLKKVELLGTVRPEFWDDLTVGKVCFYGWEYETEGRNNTIASWDEGTQMLFFTNDITSPVTNDMSGEYVWFGTYFKEEISLDDYNTYGNFWSSYSDGIAFIERADNVLGEEISVSAENLSIINFNRQIYLSSRSKLTLSLTNVEQSGAEIACNMFTQATNSRSTYTTRSIDVHDNGYVIVGGREALTAQNILGSGHYIHPNVIPDMDGDHFHDNNAGALRFYSASGPKPVNPEDVAIINNFTASGNGEYDLLLSSSMPSEINNISCNLLYIGHNTVINTATLNTVLTSPQSQPNSGFDYVIEINDFELLGKITLAWDVSRQERTILNLNNASIPTTVTGDYKIISESASLQELNIDGLQILRQDPVTIYVDGENRPTTPTYADVLIRPTNFEAVNINNLTVDRFWDLALLIGGQVNDPTGFNLKIRITNSELLLSTITGAGTFVQPSRYINDMIEIENSVIRNDIARRTMLSAFMKITPISAVFPTTKSINASLALLDPKLPQTANLTFSNVLQVDFEHDQYNVNSGTISHVAAILRNVLNTNVASNMTMCGCYNGDILVTAVGGSIVFTKFDAITNQDGNIINDFTLLVGQTARLVSDRLHIFSTAADTPVLNNLVGTGDGVVVVFSNELSNRRIIPGTLSIVAGAITGTDNGSGLITGTGITEGYVDYFGGSIYIRFTVAPANAVQVLANYNTPTGIRNVGAWTVELEP